MSNRAIFSNTAARKLAEQAMVGGLSPRKSRRLGRLLEDSDADRRAYGQLAQLFGALEGSDPDTLTQGQQERILACVKQHVVPGGARRRWSLWALKSSPTNSLRVAGIADPSPLPALRLKTGNNKYRHLRRALAAGRLGAPARSGICRKALKPLVAGALAAAVLLLVPGLLVLNRGPEQPGTLQSRGIDAPGAPGARPSDLVDLRAFCIRQGVMKKQPLRQAPYHPDSRCLSGDRLQLMVTHTAGYSHLLVVGHLRTTTGQDRMLWYYPVPPTGSSGEAPGPVEYQALGQAIELSVNHRPGEARIVAVFSRAPLDAEQVYRWLATVPRRDSAVELLQRISGRELSVVEQRVQIKPPEVQ